MGNVSGFGFQLGWSIRRKQALRIKNFRSFAAPYRLQLGPGSAWVKPDNHWINVDVDPKRADMIIDFQEFDSFPLKDSSVDCIYGSHVFEHMSIWVTDRVFQECCRVLRPGGVMRLILPDVERSINEYVFKNKEFSLFLRREKRAKNRHDKNLTIFECMKEDFLSKSMQPNLLGQRALAHQNAWDFESIKKDLLNARFSYVNRSGFQQSEFSVFSFEGTFPSEGNEYDRSLYVEAIK